MSSAHCSINRANTDSLKEQMLSFSLLRNASQTTVCAHISSPGANHLFIPHKYLSCQHSSISSSWFHNWATHTVYVCTVYMYLCTANVHTVYSVLGSALLHCSGQNLEPCLYLMAVWLTMFWPECLYFRMEVILRNNICNMVTLMHLSV